MLPDCHDFNYDLQFINAMKKKTKTLQYMRIDNSQPINKKAEIGSILIGTVLTLVMIAIVGLAAYYLITGA